MIRICSRFGNYVDHGAAGASQLGRVAVAVDLELLHRVLTELIRCATGAGAAQRLSKESVVIVGAVDCE